MQSRDRSQSNLGGGFIEFLFSGGGERQAAAPAPMRPLPLPQEDMAPQREEMAPQQAGPAYVPAQPLLMQQASAPENPPGVGYGQPAYAPVDHKFDRQTVEYHGSEKPGTIVINTNERLLYLVEGNGKALRYGVGVGKPGFSWSGEHTITAKREWPDWRPPAEMIKRRPDLPRFMPGGIDNPLGARALYLGSTLYRIHGSNEPWTIGKRVSSGCIRMRNQDVEDLYTRVGVGTKVIVI
jgi:lipoprotein-anchoring transpeptidase ErfK/SrfK